MAPGAQASHGPESPNTPPEEVPILASLFVTPPELEPPDEPLLVAEPDPDSVESMAPPSKPSLEPADAPGEQDAPRHAVNIGAKRTMEGPPVMACTALLAVAIAVRPAPSEATRPRRSLADLQPRDTSSPRRSLRSHCRLWKRRCWSCPRPTPRFRRRRSYSR